MTIPTADDDPSVTHPDVVYVPGGWNGYKFWMAYTPYPANDRENPHVACSHDGIDWTVPPGGSNPIVPLSEATSSNHSYWSDTDMLLVDGTMWLYFRGGGNSVSIDETVWRVTSTDGVTWTPKVRCLDTPQRANPNVKILSPAVQRFGATYSMWTANYDAPAKVQRRTSADGVTWSEPEDCTLPAGIVPYHLDVVVDSGIAHMLLMSEGGDLHHLVSTDGVTWYGESFPSIGPKHEHWPEYYRSTMQPKGDGSWYLWVAGWRGATSSPPWLFGFYDGLIWPDITIP